MSSSLVAGPQDVSSPFGGLLAIESGADLAEAIGNGDWTTGVLAGVGLALDTVATVIDPLGSVIAMGIGWVLEHVEPLRGWFNDLTGDAGEVAGFAQTWSNIANHLQQTGQKLNDQLNAVQDLNGQAMEAYRKVHEDAAKHVHAAGVWASGISGGMEAAGAIVKIVHDVTRDALSEVVGTACSAAIETACSFGLATPLAISQVTAKVSAMVAKVGRYIDDLITSITKLSKHLDDLMKIFNDAAGAFRSAIRGGGSSAPSSSALPGGSAGSPGSPSAPHSPGAPNSPTGPVLPKPGDSPSSPSSPDSPNPAEPPTSKPRSNESESGSSADGGDSALENPGASPTDLNPSEIADRIRKGEMTVQEVKDLPLEVRKDPELAGLDRGDGRDALGKYTGTDTVGANAEARGLQEVSDQYQKPVIDDRVGVRVEGRGDQLRYYDGLIHVEGNKYVGIEVKSGSAIDKYHQPSSAQLPFDKLVSPENPARGTYKGQPIEIIAVHVKEVN